MINAIIKRLALAAAILWVAIIALFGFANAEHVRFFGFLLVFGLLPAMAAIGAAWLACWVIGPVGRLGNPENRHYYEILDP